MPGKRRHPNRPRRKPPLDADSLDVGITRAVLQRLDGQMLACFEDEPLTAPQRTGLLTWTHDYLLSTYLAFHMDCYPGTIRPASSRPIRPCFGEVRAISEMLRGGVPLGPDLTLQCPPAGCCPHALALGRQMPAWLHRQIVRAAQRTRLHAEEELTALWRAVEAHLITGAVVWFELAEWLEVEVPTAEALGTLTRACLDAARGERGILWNSASAALPT